MKSGDERLFTVALVVHDSIHVNCWDADDRAVEFAAFDIVFDLGEDLLDDAHAGVFVAMYGRRKG